MAILGGGLAGLDARAAAQARTTRDEHLHRREAQGPGARGGVQGRRVDRRGVGALLRRRARAAGALDNDEIHKFGLRWWFPAGDNTRLAERIERGINKPLPEPSYQLDRGRFENYLGEQAVSRRASTCSATAASQDVEIGDPHVITRDLDGEDREVRARWVVDAAGRSFILKRKLDLLEDNGHVVNSAWFRLDGGLDIEDWADPDDEEFFGRMSERGLRQYSTNHLCGQGYWVWMIPLSSGPISIGIVADPRFHPYEEMKTLDGRAGLDPPSTSRSSASRSTGGSTRSRTSSRCRTSRTGASSASTARSLVAGRRGGRVPGPVLLAGVGLHRDLEHADDRPDHAVPGRRGRDGARARPSTTCT